MKTLAQLKEEKQSNLIHLADCSIIEIIENVVDRPGCYTCDYGSRYGVDYIFKFSDGRKYETEITNSYGSRISQGDMMFFLLNNLDTFATMTKAEFIQLLKDPDSILGEDY